MVKLPHTGQQGLAQRGGEDCSQNESLEVIKISTQMEIYQTDSQTHPESIASYNVQY